MNGWIDKKFYQRNKTKKNTNENLKLKSLIFEMKKYILNLNKIQEMENKNVNDVEVNQQRLSNQEDRGKILYKTINRNSVTYDTV